MKLSVIKPCFKKLNTINKSVDAVKNSPYDYDNREIIVIDDYSIDDTRTKLRNELEKRVASIFRDTKYSSRIKLGKRKQIHR